MKPLTQSARSALRAQAHHLDPVVIVGQQGLTPAVQQEIDLALRKHELVKVRVASGDRDLRETILAQVCADMDCAPVQHLGKVLVLWRPNPDKRAPPPAQPAAKARKKPGGIRGSVPKTGPRPPVDPVRERRRSARAGTDVASGKGRRGAARHEPLASQDAPLPPARKKSSYTPKTRPKSFSAKPNPRSAWEKPPPKSAATAAGPRARRRRAP